MIINDKEMLLHHLYMYSKPSIVLPVVQRLESKLISEFGQSSMDVLSLRVKLTAVYMLQGDGDSTKRHLAFLDQSDFRDTKFEYKLMYEALKHAVEGNPVEALNTYKRILEINPTNLTALYVGYQHAIQLYDMKWFYELLRDHVMPKFQNRSDHVTFHFGHYIKSFYCFALEEMGKLEEAERMGRESEKDFEAYKSAIDPEIASQMICPWTQHSLCHVLHTEGRYDEAIEYMEKRRLQWHSCNSFLQTHNYWHLALLYLNRNLEGDLEKAFQILKSHIWIDHSADEQPDPDIPSWKSDPAVNTGAINLLWSMDMKQGLDQNVIKENEYLWPDILSYIREPIRNKHTFAFNDAHFAYILARNCMSNDSLKPDLYNFRMSLRERSRKSDEYSHVYSKFVIPLTDAIIAYSEKRYLNAKRLLEPMFTGSSDGTGTPYHRHNAIGGSLLQRTVLDCFWNRINRELDQQSQ